MNIMGGTSRQSPNIVVAWAVDEWRAAARRVDHHTRRSMGYNQFLGQQVAYLHAIAIVTGIDVVALPFRLDA